MSDCVHVGHDVHAWNLIDFCRIHAEKDLLFDLISSRTM